MISAAAVTKLKERKEWLTATPSSLLDHGRCCAQARSWLIATSRSLDFASTDGFALSAPRWLTLRYKWGPTRWPLSWCEAVREKTIDCGVFATFAREIFSAKGLRVSGGQVLRVESRESTNHWRAKWSALPGAFDWIGDGVVYHEVVMIEPPAEPAPGQPPQILVYDPTEGLWLDPSIVAGHGSHRAIRADLPAARHWGEHVLTPKQWLELQHD